MKGDWARQPARRRAARRLRLAANRANELGGAPRKQSRQSLARTRHAPPRWRGCGPRLRGPGTRWGGHHGLRLRVLLLGHPEEHPDQLVLTGLELLVGLRAVPTHLLLVHLELLDPLREGDHVA